MLKYSIHTEKNIVETAVCILHLSDNAVKIKIHIMKTTPYILVKKTQKIFLFQQEFFSGTGYCCIYNIFLGVYTITIIGVFSS